MKKLLTVSAALSALFASGAYAQTLDQAKYFTIDENSVMITGVTDKGGTINAPAGPATPSIPLPTPPAVNPPANPGGDGGPDRRHRLDRRAGWQPRVACEVGSRQHSEVA